MKSYYDIKGYTSLNAEQKKLFKETYEAHLSIMGTDMKEKHAIDRIQEIKWDQSENCLKIFFDNGDWFHYLQDGTWF